MFVHYYGLTVNLNQVASIKPDTNFLTITFFAAPKKNYNKEKDPPIITQWLFDDIEELRKAILFLDSKLGVIYYE